MTWRPHVQLLNKSDGHPAGPNILRAVANLTSVALPLASGPERARSFLEATEWQPDRISPGSAISIIGFPHVIAGAGSLGHLEKGPHSRSELLLLVNPTCHVFERRRRFRPKVRHSSIRSRPVARYLRRLGESERQQRQLRHRDHVVVYDVRAANPVLEGWGYRISLHFIELPSEDFAVAACGDARRGGRTFRA